MTRVTRHRCEVVLLVGFMRVLSGKFCRRWRRRCLNVHPSLLPAFAGGMDLQVHAAISRCIHMLYVCYL